METLEIWQILAICGIVLIILEMFTPAMLFLNLSLASFATAITALFTTDLSILIPFWVIASGVFLIFLRPVLVKSKNGADSQTGMGQYVGKKAKVIEEITPDSGVISIFDERWNARSSAGENIPAGSFVIIERNENLTMFVKKEN